MAKALSQNDAFLAESQEAVADPIFKEILAKHSITPLGRKTVIFKMRNPPNGKYNLNNTDDVYDAETKSMRRLRILRGNTEIWQDKQDKIDKEYIAKNKARITFIHGNLLLDEVSDAHVIKALRLMNANEGNEHRLPGKKRSFYEWDPAAQEREAFQLEMEQNEVSALAMSVPLEKMKKHALFLGVIIHDEVGNIRSEQGIRVLYSRKAKENPKIFRETLDSPEVEYKYLIRRAILDSKIETVGNNIKWSAGGFITKLPNGKDTVEYLTEFAMLPTDEGKSFVERLQKIAL